MDESILKTLKSLLGVSEGVDVFDDEIMVLANSAFMTLHQLGVGTIEPFNLNSEFQIWEEFCDNNNFASAKVFVYLQIRVAFDPPTSAFVLTAIERQLDELTWRLREQAMLLAPEEAP